LDQEHIMSLEHLLFAVAGASVIWGIVAGMLIFSSLQKRGEKVSFLWIRLLLPLYVHRYAQLTRAESGRVGPLFFHYVFAFNLALVAAVAAAIV
jgi:hypothetical protein